MKIQFFNSPEDCQWLRDTALKDFTLPPDARGFKSFVLHGNEDSPDKLDLYMGEDPLYTDRCYRVKLTDPYGDGLWLVTGKWL